MRTSLFEIQQNERFLMHEAEPGERLLFEARLQLDEQLAENVRWQQKTYELVREYGRQKLRERLRRVDEKLFASAEHQPFINRIKSIFKKH